MTFKLIKRPPKARQQYQTLRNNVGAKQAVILADAVKQRERVVVGWDTPHSFGFTVNFPPGHIVSRLFVVSKKAEQAGVTVWHLLSFGTRIRYAQISEDFQAKTKVGVFTSGPGGGSITEIDKENPQPGITKRDWDKIINAITDERMAAAIRNRGL